MELSLVITLFNEEQNVKPLLESIDAALTAYDYEVILIDDGSTDKTVKEIKQHAGDRVKLLVLNSNYGQTAAMAAGIAEAQGDYIVTLDGDLQNDPTDIPFMLEKLKDEDWDVVAGNRKNRQDGALLRKIPSKIANRLIRKLTGVTIRDYGCTLKVFKKETAKNLGLYGELHRFIPLLAVMEGGRIVDVDVKHHPRKFGVSKYGLGRTMKVMSDLLLMLFFKKYFRRPIHFFGPLGMACFGLGSIICVYLLVVKLMGNDIWGRPLLILGITLVLGGIQFLTFGLIAELIMRVYYESQHKKTYGIREVYTKNHRRLNWKLGIKIAVSALAIYWVSRQVDIKALGHWLATVPLLYTLAAFVLYNISKIAGAYRLNLFFRADGIRLAESENLLLYYKGMFYNLFLPGGIGGDGYKIVYITRTLQVAWRRAFKGVLWDRISGAVALLFLSLVLLLFVPALRAHSFLVSVIAVGALITLPVFYIVTIWVWPAYRASALYSNGLAIGIQVLQGVAAVILFKGLGIPLHQVSEYLVVFFISSLATILPITVGGIGIRELVFILAARYTTIDQEQAVAFSILFFFLNAVSALIGAFVTVNVKKTAVSL